MRQSLQTILGPIPSTTMQYYDGKEYDIFTVSAGVHFFVTLVYPGDSQKRLADVMHFRKKTIWQLIDIIGLDVAMGTEGSGVALEALADRIADEIAEKVAEEEQAKAEAASEEPVETFTEEVQEEEDLDSEDIFGLGETDDTEAIALDLDDDFSDLDEDLGDLDSFWDDAAEDAGKDSGRCNFYGRSHGIGFP